MTSQKTTTPRLWASTQRVSENIELTLLSPEELGSEGRDLGHRREDVELAGDLELVIEICHVGGDLGKPGAQRQGPLRLKQDQATTKLESGQLESVDLVRGHDTTFPSKLAA